VKQWRTTRQPSLALPPWNLSLAYNSLTPRMVGTLLNLLKFIVLCQRPIRDTTAKPTLHFVRTIALFDILMLYGWNLDHYVSIAYHFSILTRSVASCKWISFISYLAPQTSAWLRVFVCLDRSISFVKSSASHLVESLEKRAHRDQQYYHPSCPVESSFTSLCLQSESERKDHCPRFVLSDLSNVGLRSFRGLQLSATDSDVNSQLFSRSLLASSASE
jgi:hypothetical protein